MPSIKANATMTKQIIKNVAFLLFFITIASLLSAVNKTAHIFKTGTGIRRLSE